MKTKVELKEGQVFYPKNGAARHSHRRIIGFVADRVFFSAGGGTQLLSKAQNLLGLARAAS